MKYAGSKGFIRMSWGADFSASTLVSWTTAPLLDAYAAYRSVATSPKSKATLMILPYLADTLSSP